MNNKKLKNSIFSLKTYVIFFLLISFVVTCSMLLFLNNIQLSKEVLKENAPKTFINIIFLSVVCTLFDGIRKKYTIERPVKRILAGTQRITQGDFHTHIQTFHSLESRNEFDVIIEDLNKMIDELSSIETLRSDFISNVSHELKTPIAIISNYITMLQDPYIDKEKKDEYIQSIDTAIKRLSALITNILKLNKLENQQIFPSHKSFSLSEQLCLCLLGFEDIWEKKNIDIETDIEDEVMIDGDEELLSLVWNNLLSNAFKFTDCGGKVSVVLKKEEESVIVKVIDNGCGMDSDIGKHIFDKFYQGDESHAMQGNGLGLALVKRVVDIVGGDIFVTSTKGQGSEFSVRLPIKNY